MAILCCSFILFDSRYEHSVQTEQMPYTGSGTPCRQLRWAMPPFLPYGRHSVSPNGRSIIGSILFIAFFLLISRLYIIYFNLYIIHYYIFLLTYIRSRIYITLSLKSDGEMAKTNPYENDFS